MIPPERLTSQDAARLADFFSRSSHPEGTFSLGEVQGFLFAVLAGPDLVKPSEWLPELFAGREPAFETMDEAQSVMSALMALYNQIARDVRRAGTRLPLGCELREGLLENLEADAPISSWCQGFIRGHSWLEESWTDLPAEMEEELGPVLAVISFFASRRMAEEIAREMNGDEASLLEIAAKIRRLFPQAVAEYAEMGRALSTVIPNVTQKREQASGATAPVGRNEPCPCGSGKKYKRCCGTSTK